MTYVVTITNNGIEYPLRGTIWAFSMDRAQTFENYESAAAALQKARKFIPAAQFKKAVIKQV